MKTLTQISKPVTSVPCGALALESRRRRAHVALAPRCGVAPVSNNAGAVNGEVRVVGAKRPRPSPPEMEASPLCAPASTAEERNAYLRTVGTERMKQVTLLAHGGIAPLVAFRVSWLASRGSSGRMGRAKGGGVGGGYACMPWMDVLATNRALAPTRRTPLPVFVCNFQCISRESRETARC